MIFNIFKSTRGLVKPADYTTATRPIISSLGTWKASRDCWVRVSLEYGLSSKTKSSLYINDKLFYECGVDGYRMSYPGIYINKGDELKITGHRGTLTVYYCR